MADKDSKQKSKGDDKKQKQETHPYKKKEGLNPDHYPRHGKRGT